MSQFSNDITEQEVVSLPEDYEAAPTMISVLQSLWDITAAAPQKTCSLAKLSKQSQRQMSILKRQLTLLSNAGFVEVCSQDDGSGTVKLTAAGLDICTNLFHGHQ